MCIDNININRMENTTHMYLINSKSQMINQMSMKSTLPTFQNSLSTLTYLD